MVITGFSVLCKILPCQYCIGVNEPVVVEHIYADQNEVKNSATTIAMGRPLNLYRGDRGWL